MASTIQTIGYATIGSFIAPHLGVAPGLSAPICALVDRVYSKFSYETSQKANLLDTSLGNLIGVTAVIHLTKANSTIGATVKEQVTFPLISWSVFEGIRAATNYIAPSKYLNQAVNHPVVRFGTTIGLTALISNIAKDYLPTDPVSATYVTAAFAGVTAGGIVLYDGAQYLSSKSASKKLQTLQSDISAIVIKHANTL